MEFCTHRNKLKACYMRNRVVLGVKEQSELEPWSERPFTCAEGHSTQVISMLRAYKGHSMRKRRFSATLFD